MFGNIFSIEEFSVYDGPGIRTSIFLKGCPLRCMWCHNPEGQSAMTEIIKSPNGCIGCKMCIKTSITRPDGSLALTDESIKSCPMNLIRKCGESISSDSLCDKLLKNKRLLEDGGVTFSGGEPLMQSDFVLECISKLKGNLHTAIQTSGYCDSEIFGRALTVADYFLFDLKLADERLHKKYTGASNKCILHNFAKLAKSNTPFVVRIPLIPGVTDTPSNIEQISQILKDNNVNYVELLPYNKMAGSKYKMLMRNYQPDFDEKLQPQTHEDLFLSFGIKTKIM